MKTFKPVPQEVLKAFGFKKIRKKVSDDPKYKPSYYNEELDLYYWPKIHTIERFGQNLVDGVVHHVSKAISGEVMNIAPRLK